MSKVNQSRIREALTAGTNVKEKGPPVADGILSVTPDTPEMLEWRSRSALDVAETSSTFLDDEDDGPKPHELYGKFTWKIENFSEISKRELRSNVFDVGSYKWYILVYPQGCDVCNHLSLFLCVADYDKLLPGWSHFAQFTIAVVNKDPKKSKYSDTLHRFCKKEHDWGWKKFMELSKVLDGFTVADTLVIKAQVQVILDKPSKPFRCLDPQYRRELVRVYLTNVEGICRRFCDDKKARLSWVREEGNAFRHFWASLTPEQQRKYLTDKGEVILKAVVKQFFNEKEVTSTLVMDALYSGCKQIEEHSRTWLEGKCSDNAPVVLIKAERNSFTLCGDLMEIADRVQKDYIPAAKDDNKAMQPNDGLTLRSGQDGDDYRRDSIERDEKRLAELGRKTIEMFVISHIFCEKLEIAYREAEALKRQDQLIAEEFEMARLEESKAQAKAMADKEKKAKKKEKMKQKKEAEKLKREAEEAERKAREEELRRQEAERKAKEAEKKRLEDAQAQPLAQQQQAQQQPHQQQARKQSKGKEDKKAVQQQQQQQQAKAKQPAAAQQQQAASRPAAGPSASGPPSLSSIAAAAVSESAAAAAASASSLPERPGANEDPSSDSGSEEVGTVNQATGAAESSGDGEDEVEQVASRGAAAAGAAASDSDGDSDGRAALEEEVTILRAQVSQLQRALAERDAEVYSLRAQLAESHLAQVHLAQQLAEAVAKEAPVASSNARTSGTNTSSSGSAAADGSLGAGREAAAADGSSSAATAGSRSEAERGPGKSDAAAANGPKEVLSTSTVPPSAAAAAAAAVRRMQGGPAAPSAAAQNHDAGHHGAASRSAAPGAPAAVAGRGAPSGASGSAAAAAAADLGSAGSMMQRSTSATLPSAAPGAGTGSATFTPAQLAAAAAATANGRGREAAAGASGATAGATAAVGAGAKSFLPAGASSATSASGTASSAAATSNGISGVLHSSSGAAPAQDGLPSYRNAAAGVLAAGQPSGSATMVSVSTAPMIPAPASAAAAGVGQGKRVDEGAGAPAATAAARLGVSAPSTDGFSATNARIIMQQAQQQRSSNMAFSTPTAVPPASAKRMAASTQLDSPGLEDFAHINMIDDLLTE
ncbi:hypothetical protein HYH02_002956 [Chlamydomonas schloesseri]|uniref:MATH domain-containing protein n=1 Tax=Chlamydomonas schloesseri TaxID=2026947 RepID=A0A835WS83_9CHLO|nr:hypothetical protein HYH02_002956 [Chlamydomonas schloesseri]|eukprot:KAG2452725.1 hypothetical protein HYH02_002956 [Chlamydomonas schloesseri]